MSTSPGIFVVVSIAVLLLGSIAALAARSGASTGGAQLHQGLARLADLDGKTEADFVAALGCNPTSISGMAFGQRLLQWQISGQHLAVLFDADHRFVRITHRHGV